jgi:hypothetical protein
MATMGASVLGCFQQYTASAFVATALHSTTRRSRVVQPAAPPANGLDEWWTP